MDNLLYHQGTLLLSILMGGHELARANFTGGRATGQLALRLAAQRSAAVAKSTSPAPELSPLKPPNTTELKTTEQVLKTGQGLQIGQVFIQFDGKTENSGKAKLSTVLPKSFKVSIEAEPAKPAISPHEASENSHIEFKRLPGGHVWLGPHKIKMVEWVGDDSVKLEINATNEAKPRLLNQEEADAAMSKPSSIKTTLRLEAKECAKRLKPAQAIQIGPILVSYIKADKKNHQVQLEIKAPKPFRFHRGETPAPVALDTWQQDEPSSKIETLSPGEKFWIGQTRIRIIEIKSNGSIEIACKAPGAYRIDRINPDGVPAAEATPSLT